MRRFGVFQKDEWRPIDDATEAGFRSIIGSDEKISLIRSDSPARIAAGFYQAQMSWQERLVSTGIKWESQHGSAVLNTPDAYEHGKEDVRKAFRRLPARDPWVVCVYNPVFRKAVFIILLPPLYLAQSALYTVGTACQPCTLTLRAACLPSPRLTTMTTFNSAVLTTINGQHNRVSSILWY